MKFSDTCTAGTTHIKVLDNEGNLIETLPITIREPRQLKEITLSTSVLTLYKGQFGGVIDITGQDQYGKNLPLCEAKYFDNLNIQMRSATEDIKVVPEINLIKTADKRVQIKVNAISDEVPAGVYRYVFNSQCDKQVITINIVDKSKLVDNFELEKSIEIDLASNNKEVNKQIILSGGLCNNETLKFTVEISNENNTYPIPKIVQDEEGNFLLNLDLSDETVTAGRYQYLIKCEYESKEVSKEIKRTIIVQVKGEKPLETQITEEAIVVSQEPGVLLLAEGHGEVKADFTVTPEGTKVTLTAFPEQGYKLKEWKVLEGTAEIIDNSFILQNQPVTIQGIFEVIGTQAP